MSTKQNGNWSSNWAGNHSMTITANYFPHHVTGYGENAI